jgi:DNA invertase Pin-like site-specific DNA recombinase
MSTGERIRDKIAASKRRGMWMGGLPPPLKREAPLRLTNIEDVLRELRSIYRSAKDESRDVAKATKLAYGPVSRHH